MQDQGGAVTPARTGHDTRHFRSLLPLGLQCTRLQLLGVSMIYTSLTQPFATWASVHAPAAPGGQYDI
jgi:hypothetical protein